LSDIAIEVTNISKTFNLQQKKILNFADRFKNSKKFFSLENISFSVPKGKMYGIIGLNGSGKTTLLRIIAGIYKPDSGTVTFSGKLSPIIQTGMGINEEYTAKENILTSGIILGIDKSVISTKIDKIIQFAELEKFTNLKLKHYSSGMKARLACSIALEINSDILLMDEMLIAGDIRFKKKSFRAFLRFIHQGKTILYTTHNLRMSTRYSDKIILLDDGKLVMIGEPEEVVEKYKKIAANKKLNY